MTGDPTYPNDANGDVLRRMKVDGDDLSKPRDIEFYFAFDTEEQAIAFAKCVALETGLYAVAEPYEEREIWQGRVVKFMTPTHAEITDLERMLGRIAARYDGDPDGWGCMQVG